MPYQRQDYVKHELAHAIMNLACGVIPDSIEATDHGGVCCSDIPKLDGWGKVLVGLAGSVWSDTDPSVGDGELIQSGLIELETGLTSDLRRRAVRVIYNTVGAHWDEDLEAHLAAHSRIDRHELESFVRVKTSPLNRFASLFDQRGKCSSGCVSSGRAPVRRLSGRKSTSPAYAALREVSQMVFNGDLP